MSDDRATHPVKCDEVKKEDLMAFIYYAHVDVVHDGGTNLLVRGASVGTPQSFVVKGKELVESSLSADQYHETKKVTKTEAAAILISSHNRPLTVVFEKQDGTERRLRGRLLKHESLLGRSFVEDLDVKEEHKTRLVDHRTIRTLIVDGVKYVTK